MYEKDDAFRGYVDRYARHHGISTEEALKHALVKSYAEREKDG
jgi:hypothetical protein